MRVRMKATLSGTRDGVAWPPRGGTVDLPDEEAAHLLAAGLAETAADDSQPVEETATPPETAETAVPTPRRGRKSSKE